MTMSSILLRSSWAIWTKRIYWFSKFW